MSDSEIFIREHKKITEIYETGIAKGISFVIDVLLRDFEIKIRKKVSELMIDKYKETT